MESKKNILIVDDEEGIRMTLAFFLEREGYDVTTAESYDQCMALFGEKTFDLIFVDILLGGKTGLDLIRELRASDTRCPIVVITGDPTIEGFSAARTLGVTDYIPKPVLKETLLNIANSLLSPC